MCVLMLVSLLKIIIILQLIFSLCIYIHHVHVSHHHHTERNSVITVAVGFFVYVCHAIEKLCLIII